MFFFFWSETYNMLYGKDVRGCVFLVKSEMMWSSVRFGCYPWDFAALKWLESSPRIYILFLDLHKY